jgi:hypothetical protein
MISSSHSETTHFESPQWLHCSIFFELVGVVNGDDVLTIPWITRSFTDLKDVVGSATSSRIEELLAA